MTAYRIDRHRKLGEFGGINDAIFAAKEFLNHRSPLIVVYEDDEIVKPVARVEIDLFKVTMLDKK